MGKTIIKKIFIIIINLIILLISFFIPKSKKIWLMGGWFGQRFADNSRYFYLYLNDNKKKFGIDKVVWITRNKNIFEELKKKGFEVYYTWELKSIWYHFRAKVHIIDQQPFDINPFFSIRSIRINLWHGFPLKKIGTYIKNIDSKSDIKNRLRIIKEKLNINFDSPGLWSKHYLLATSLFSAKILGNAFNVPRKEILIASYPRNDVFFNNNFENYLMDKENSILKTVKESKRKNMLILSYFPTFRDNKVTYLFGSKNEDELSNFHDFLEENNILLISKFHFVGEKNYKVFNNYSNIVINLSPEMDICFILKYTDILITDYSSIYFDFLLHNKPIIFYPYDLEYYKSKDRGLIFDYDKFTPGPKAYNLNQLKKIIMEVIKNNKEHLNIYEPERIELNDKINDTSKILGGEYLAKEIIDILK
jgi:CDP-glycerol glycerophosphotransferase